MERVYSEIFDVSQNSNNDNKLSNLIETTISSSSKVAGYISFAAGMLTIVSIAINIYNV